MKHNKYEHINAEQRDNILILNLDSTKKLNTVNKRLQDELGTIFFNLQLDKKSDVIARSGAASAFSADGDIKFM